MSEPLQVFRIPRTTATHADVLAAVGLADVLASIPGIGPVTVMERAGAFEVRANRSLDEEDFKQMPATPGYPFLQANEKVKVPAGAEDPVDYKAEKAKADRIKQTPGGKGRRRQRTSDPELQQLIDEDKPREDWRLLQVLNALQGDETSNKVHETIISQQPEAVRAAVAGALRAFVEQGASGLDWKVSTVQLFAPTAAKGYSRLKPDSTDRNDKTKEQWADPLLEWFRYRGYFRVACPFFQGSKGEHVRLLCPIPHNISVRALQSVARDLRREGVYGGAPKLDSLAVLRLAQLLIERSEEYHAPDVDPYEGVVLQDMTPADLISGIAVTHYQSLGNAKAVSAMSTIALPGWFRIETKQDAEDWLAILDEHQRVIRGLQDDHSDEIGLLIAYRRFLEKRGESATWALIEFMEHYGPFLIRAREQGRRVRSFRADYMRRIIVETMPGLRSILDNDGFQAVAAAVRRATVSAQALKAMGSKDYREIRYDLLPDLRRKRSLSGGEQFMEAVADFISMYNTENARRREMGKRAPRNVTTEQFAEFTSLIDQYGAPIVGALLCAYGSCREPREEDQPDVEDATTDTDPE